MTISAPFANSTRILSRVASALFQRGGGGGPTLALFPALSVAANPMKLLQQQDSSNSEGEATGEPAAPDEGLKVEELIDGDPLKGETWKDLADRLLDNAIGFLPDLVYAILVFFFFLLAARLASRVLKRVLERTSSDPALQSIVLGVTRYTLLFLGGIMAMSQLGFQVGSLIASLGIAGLAIGLAAQDSLSNLIAGFTVLWDRPFRIGDNVTIAGQFGSVQDIGLRSTRIRTVQHTDVIIPNNDVISQEIINHTMHPSLRIDIPVGIAYHESSHEARRALLSAVADYEHIETQPAPQVVVVALGDSSVNLELRVWLKNPHDEKKIGWQLNEMVKDCLDEAGIEIPFPQRTLHIGSKELAVGLQRSLTTAEPQETEEEATQ